MTHKLTEFLLETAHAVHVSLFETQSSYILVKPVWPASHHIMKEDFCTKSHCFKGLGGVGQQVEVCDVEQYRISALLLENKFCFWSSLLQGQMRNKTVLQQPQLTPLFVKQSRRATKTEE